MDYEKKYNEAVKRAKAAIDVAADKDLVKGVATTIFPELRESEDERMMREFNDYLCEEIECRTNDVRDEKDSRTLEMLCYVLKKFDAWLEKQKEENHDGKKWIYEDDYHKDMERCFNDGKDEVLENPEKYGLQKEQKPEIYSPLCDTIKDKIREYIINHFTIDTTVKTDVKSIVKAMEEGIRLGKESQKPAKWNEEDTKMLNSILLHLNKSFHEMNDAEKRMFTWLQEFPERFNLKQKPAWSEEDELMRTAVIQTLERFGGRGTIGMQIDWLKSLRTCPSWKPSDHQMNILKAVKEYVGRGSGYWGEGLGSLIEDLEKLM